VAQDALHFTHRGFLLAQCCAEWVKIRGVSPLRQVKDKPERGYTLGKKVALTANVKLDTFALLVLFTFWSYSSTQWIFSVPFVSLFGFALLYPLLRTSWIFWLVTTALLGFVIGQTWATEGNATYLFFYVSLSILVALLSEQPWWVMRLNGRWLTGLIFLFAVVWKLISPDFTSGAFMEFFLLADARVAPVAVALTSVTRTDVRENQQALSSLTEPTQLKPRHSVRRLAVMLTYATLIVEVLVAATFLLPVRQNVRDLTLCLFLFGCYALVTVPSFGIRLGENISAYLVHQTPKHKCASHSLLKEGSGCGQGCVFPLC
jgi:hypothetical protein